MKRLEIGRRMQQEIRGLLKLSPLVLASLVLVAMLWRTDSAAISGLFQSSPVETPPPSLTPTSTPEAAVTATGTLQPTAIESPGVTSTADPTESVVPAETSTEVPPTETALPTATSVPTELPPTDTPVPSSTAETAEPEATSDESQRYPEGESNLRFEWGMLFDSVALFFSYAWLCCGILLFIAIPFLFFVLWRASASRQEEGGQEED
jgi:hypothetical protein